MRRALLLALFLAAPCFLARVPCAPVFCQERVRASFGQRPRELLVAEGEDGQKCLLFYGQTCYSSLSLSSKAQESLVSAAQEYLEKFERKRLKRSGAKPAERVLAQGSVRVSWGSRKDAMNRTAVAKARFGYVFEGASPYFVINVPAVRGQSPEQGPALELSEEIRLLFTRSQLQALVSAI